MANTKEIKTRIESVKDTRKITNAMYLIASTKLRKAKSDLDKAIPYFKALRAEIKRIFRTVKNIENKYFYPVNMKEFVNGTYGILIITSDKGLAGAYNQNVIKEAMKLVNEHKDCRLFVLGEYGRQYFKKHNIEIEEDFNYSAQDPNMDLARSITNILLEEYQENRIKKIFVVYTDMENKLHDTAISNRILPFHRDYFDDSKKEKEIGNEFIFYPSVEEILDYTIESYISGFIYGALIDSFCAEQNSRMLAMSSANQNAENILQELSIEYNRIRQEVITREITEISAGAKSQKQKRKKRVKTDDR